MAFRVSNPGLQWAALVLQVVCALPHVQRALTEWGTRIPLDILEHTYTVDPGEGARPPSSHRELSLSEQTKLRS